MTRIYPLHHNNLGVPIDYNGKFEILKSFDISIHCMLVDVKLDHEVEYCNRISKTKALTDKAQILIRY